MDKFKEIRPIVLGVVRKDNKLLVSKGYDKSKNQEFYRCLGGGIEFLEKSKDALKREFKEEINIEIEIGKFLGISENIFNYKGKDAHELILFYEAYINDEDYQQEYDLVDDDSESEAIWVDIDKFKNKELVLYPEQIFKYL
jgi:ADP-ribose pyrophosphatase YjhB (NUDIX family)